MSTELCDRQLYIDISAKTCSCSKGRKRAKDIMKIIRHCPFILEDSEKLQRWKKKVLEQRNGVVSYLELALTSELDISFLESKNLKKKSLFLDTQLFPY